MIGFAPEQIAEVSHTIGFGLLGLVASLCLTPIVLAFLYRFKIWRKNSQVDPTLGIDGRSGKAHTPIMGGLIVVISIAAITLLWNWDRQFTWVPIGGMLIAAILGALDDLFSVFGRKRRNRSLRQTIVLMRVHKNLFVRIWYAFTLPWTAFKTFASSFGSKRGTGVHAHEKLLLQFAAGAITAWWIYWKLGETWKEIYIPFHGFLNIGAWIVPLIIIVVMFTANAVNISDGMDGLAGGMLIPTFIALSFFRPFSVMSHWLSSTLSPLAPSSRTRSST